MAMPEIGLRRIEANYRVRVFRERERERKGGGGCCVGELEARKFAQLPYLVANSTAQAGIAPAESSR